MQIFPGRGDGLRQIMAAYQPGGDCCRERAAGSVVVRRSDARPEELVQATICLQQHVDTVATLTMPSLYQNRTRPLVLQGTC